MLLRVEGLSVHYGAIQALHLVDLCVDSGKIVTLLGANGAGKTSLLRAVSGLVPAHRGRVLFEEKEIGSVKPADLVRRGIAHVPEGRAMFSSLSVEENLKLGAYIRTSKAEVERDFEEIYAMFPRLKERKSQMAGALSGGEQQMLAMGRALLSKPKLLLLDEPSMGLAPVLVQAVFEKFHTIRDHGTSILLVEQNAKKALQIADYAYVLENGRMVMEGEAKRLIHDSAVERAFLGVG